MPNTTSRRLFLSAAAASAGTVLVHSQALADADSLRKAKFIVVSDTHLGHRDQPTAEAQWKQTAAELTKAEGQFVLHLGDVVDGGRESQYPLYRAARETIGKAVHEIPGNHDPQPLFEKHLVRGVDRVVEDDWLRVLLLNNSRTDSHDGFLSGRQLDWLGEQLAAAASDRKLVLLAMHVPAHTNRHPDRGWHVQPQEGQTRLYELVDKHRQQIIALLHGHFHNGIRGWSDRGQAGEAPVHEIVFPSALYNENRKLTEQKAPGYNLSEFRPGYTLVEIRDRTMTLRYKPLGAEVEAEKGLELAGS
jgi:3',5'-cyclic AMP phosphodiesterase CpdA